MTDEEHMARAMLMGMVYDWRDHTYCNHDIFGELTAEGAIDADTFEPINHDEIYERMKKSGGLNKNWKERS